MTPSTQDDRTSKKTTPRSPDRDALTSGEHDLDSLKCTLQENRRAFTLIQAEAEKERDLREALQAQLLEANAEIVASWERRKEMARVIADQQAKLAEGRKEAAALKRAQKKTDDRISELEQGISERLETIANLEQVIAKRDRAITRLEQLVVKRDEAIGKLKPVIANRDQAIAKRDKVLANRQEVIANRDQKISELKDQLRARYEELAALERHIVQSTISGKAKRLARQARDMTRKSFQGS